MPRKKNTCMYLVAALLFLGGLGYLVFSGLSENTVYFLNVSEARAATADKLQAARLFGHRGPRQPAQERGTAPGPAFCCRTRTMRA